MTSLDYDTRKGRRRRRNNHEATGIYRYGSYNLYGLMDEKGKPLTAPVYHNITVLSKDLFLCALKDIYSRLLLTGMDRLSDMRINS